MHFKFLLNIHIGLLYCHDQQNLNSACEFNKLFTWQVVNSFIWIEYKALAMECQLFQRDWKA